MRRMLGQLWATATGADDDRAFAAIVALSIVTVTLFIAVILLMLSSFWYLGVVAVGYALYRLVRYALVGR